MDNYLNEAQLIAKYGDPASITFEKRNIALFPLPLDITQAIKTIPAKLYINKAIEEPLVMTLRGLIAKGLHREIVSWDGCYVYRTQRGSTSLSMHALGIAVDLNAHDNPLVIFKPGTSDHDKEVIRAQRVKWSHEFVQTWVDVGWRAGALYHNRIDGMHFEWLH